MASKLDQLKDVADRARELSSKSRSGDEERELRNLIAKGHQLREAIATDDALDKFTKSITAKGVLRGGGNEVNLGRTPEGMYAVADRDAFAKAAEVWKKGDGAKAPWGFDIAYRFKGDVDNAAAEVNSGSVSDPGNAPQPQYGGVVSPFYYPGIIEPPTRAPMIADLFAQGQTDGNLVRLVKETVTTNNTGATAEGAAYGSVKLEVSPIDFPVKDITALLPVTEDLLMDIPAMSSYLAMRLAKFVQLAEEDEIVTGVGTGNHLLGLLLADDVTTHTQGGSEDIDTAVLNLCARVYQESFLDPEWIAMSPATWAAYVTLRTDLNGGKGQFLAGPVAMAAVRQIWGLPITVTPVIPNNKVIVGNRAAGMIFRHGGLRVESSTGYGTFFGEGLVAVRAKVRTALALLRPQAIGILSLSSSSELGS